MKPRRWFRFSLRTFFVLLTLFGVWLGVQVKWIRDRHEALEWLWQNGIYGANDGQKLTVVGAGVIKASHLGLPTKAPWSLRPFFEPGVSAITVVETPDENADNLKVQELSGLFPEAQVVRMSYSKQGASKPVLYEEDIKTGISRRW